MRSTWLNTAVTVLGAAALLVPTAPASGFEGDGACTGTHADNTADFQFVGTWPNDPRAQVRAGFLNWNNHRDHTGEVLFQFNETTGVLLPDTVQVLWSDLPAGTGGSASCTAVFVNSDLSTADEWRVVGEHESGHVVGLGHTGDGESFGGDNPPMMVTCLPTLTGSMSQDDRGGQFFARSRPGPVSGTVIPLMANIGFEDDKTFWGVSNATAWIDSPGGSTGPKYLRFWPNDFEQADNDGRVFQTMSFVTAPETQRIRAQAQIKAYFDSGTSGVGKETGANQVQLFAREQTFAADTCPPADYINNRDLNDPNSPGAWAIRGQATRFGEPATHWTTISTPEWHTFSHGGQDVQVRVRHWETSPIPAGAAHVRLDNVTVRCHFADGVNRKCT